MGFRVDIEQRVGGRIHFYPPKGQDTSFFKKEGGQVLAYEPNKKLVYEFAICKDTPEMAAKRESPSRVTYELTPMGDMVRLLLIHENLIPEDTVKDVNSLKGINNGWPAILSSLKSLLETGQAIALTRPTKN